MKPIKMPQTIAGYRIDTFKTYADYIKQERADGRLDTTCTRCGRLLIGAQVALCRQCEYELGIPAPVTK